MGVIKAVRVRQSRWPKTCPQCLGAISPPELIASRRRPDGTPGPWVHASHVIDENRAAATCPCTEGRPQDCKPEDWPAAHRPEPAASG